MPPWFKSLSGRLVLLSRTDVCVCVCVCVCVLNTVHTHGSLDVLALQCLRCYERPRDLFMGCSVATPPNSIGAGFQPFMASDPLKCFIAYRDKA